MLFNRFNKNIIPSYNLPSAPPLLKRSPRTIEVYDFNDLVDYHTAWRYQQHLSQQRIESSRTQSSSLLSSSSSSSSPSLAASSSLSSLPLPQNHLNDAVIFLEHHGVYTLGRGATTSNIRVQEEQLPYPLVRVERGGQITYHGPGQLVVYPILDLRFYKQDLHWYVRAMEEVVIQVLRYYQIKATREAGLTGVWCDQKKIAAIGMNISRWITLHGFALNVCTNLSDFNYIVPCGIGDRQVTSLNHYIPNITVNDVKPVVLHYFRRIFHTYPIFASPHSLDLSCANSAVPLSFVK